MKDPQCLLLSRYRIIMHNVGTINGSIQLSIMLVLYTISGDKKRNHFTSKTNKWIPTLPQIHHESWNKSQKKITKSQKHAKTKDNLAPKKSHYLDHLPIPPVSMKFHSSLSTKPSWVSMLIANRKAKRSCKFKFIQYTVN